MQNESELKMAPHFTLKRMSLQVEQFPEVHRSLARIIRGRKRWEMGARVAVMRQLVLQ